MAKCTFFSIPHGLKAQSLEYSVGNPNIPMFQSRFKMCVIVYHLKDQGISFRSYMHFP